MAGASSAGTVTSASSLLKEVYNPKAVIPHAASLRQASAHCAIFPTAASRRSLGRVSVPVWPVTLSGRLPVVALVGHYPTNKLIGRGPIPSRKPFPPPTMRPAEISGISPNFLELSQSRGQVAHVLLTRSPLEHPPEGGASFDLHVLSTPPAFVLSQDQTLRRCIRSGREPRASTLDINQPKESQPDPKIRHGVKLGTDFRHAVEFSKSGRTTTRPSRAP